MRDRSPVCKSFFNGNRAVKSSVHLSGISMRRIFVTDRCNSPGHRSGSVPRTDRIVVETQLLRSSHACLSGKRERCSPPYRRKSDSIDWKRASDGIHTGICQVAARIDLSSYVETWFSRSRHSIRRPISRQRTPRHPSRSHALVESRSRSLLPPRAHSFPRH